MYTYVILYIYILFYYPSVHLCLYFLWGYQSWGYPWGYQWPQLMGSGRPRLTCLARMTLRQPRRRGVNEHVLTVD